MGSDLKKDLLQRMFRYPVPCPECFDGPGHLVSHLLNGHSFFVTQKVALFGKMQLEWRYMPATCIIMSTLDEDETFSLAGYLPDADGYILRTLEEEIHEIISSQFLILAMLWNTLGNVYVAFPGRLAAIIVGIRKALQLPYDSRSTIILAPLSLKMLRLRDELLAVGHGAFAEREVIKEEATVTINLMLTSLATRSIFGGQNGRRIFCARATGGGPAAVGWLAPCDG
jgi:hypothetical protein